MSDGQPEAGKEKEKPPQEPSSEDEIDWGPRCLFPLEKRFREIKAFPDTAYKYAGQ